MNAVSIFIIWSAIQTISFADSVDYDVNSPSNRHCGSVSSSCPSWSYCSSNNTCLCFDWNYIVLCSENGDRGGVLQCQCLTLDNNATVGGSCIYNCHMYRRNYFISNPAYTTLPDRLADLNEAMCGRFNRTGPLCSRCIEGTYMKAYSYSMMCTPCSGGWINVLKYALVAFVPLTLFYIVILTFSINIPSSKLQGFVLISQIVTSPISLRIFDLNFSLKIKTSIVLKIFGIFFGIWNLDFFRLLDLDICFKTDALAVLSLDILIAVYPFVLIIVTHLMITLHNRNFKPIHVICKVPLFLTAKLCRRNFNIKTSTVDAFVTFMLLSYGKTLYVCFDLLAPVAIHSMEEKGKRNAVFMDASLSYFGDEHKF